jgi:hypothetical protein
LVWIGTNAILIYMAAHGVVNFESTSQFLFGGAIGKLPVIWQHSLVWMGVLLIQLFVLRFLYRRKLFFKAYKSIVSRTVTTQSKIPLKKLKSLLFFALCLLSFSASAQSVQKQSYALIKRLIPQRANSFIVQEIASTTTHDCFEIESSNGKIILRGNNGVAVASASILLFN